MALRGIQEYIARDANNIARVESQGNNNIIALLLTKRVEYTILLATQSPIWIIMLHICDTLFCVIILLIAFRRVAFTFILKS